MNFSYCTVFLKKRNISSNIKRSKVTEYAALIYHTLKPTFKELLNQHSKQKILAIFPRDEKLYIHVNQHLKCLSSI